jgi:31-O-methyltransferase
MLQPKEVPMNKLDSAIVENKESTCQVSHPAIGEIYCLNAPEARATLHEICDDQLYLQAGVSISAGDVVVDVGANIGVFTLYAAKQGAQVYAYEPMPPTYAVLQQNVEAHGLGRLVRIRNIGLSDRAEEKMMFHYPNLSVCDSWTAQDKLFEYHTENWETALEILENADPDQYTAIRRLASQSQQQAAVHAWIKNVSTPAAQIKCKFDTLSGVICQENIKTIDLLKLDAELADWEILRGVKVDDWRRIRQVAMEIHVQSDLVSISQFLSQRGFSDVTGKQLKIGTSCVWARK